MKKMLFLAVLFFVCSMSAALYAQHPSSERIAQYHQLKQQREQLIKEGNSFSTPWTAARKKKEAEELRQRIYSEYRDVELWNLQQTQKYIQESIDLFPEGIPWVPNNMFPKENLSKLYKEQPELFLELIIAYPCNIASLDTSLLLDLAANNRAFAKYMDDYVLYLISFRLSPECATRTKKDYQKIFNLQENGGNKKWLMSFMASETQRCVYQKEKRLAKQELSHMLRRAK